MPGYSFHSMSLSVRVQDTPLFYSNPRNGDVPFQITYNEREAMQKSRAKLAFVLRNRYIDDGIAHSGIPIDQEAIIAAISRRDMDEATRLVPEEAVEAFAIWGDRQRCARRLQQYIDAGVTEPVLYLTGDETDRSESLAVIREFGAA